MSAARPGATRRAVVAGAALAGAGALLRPRRAAAADADVLAPVLAAHELLASLAEENAARLPANLEDLPAATRRQLRELRALGEETSFAPLRRPRGTGLAALVDAEERAIGACYRAVQRLEAVRAVETVGRVMAENGGYLALLRLATGRAPVPEAFETGSAS